MKFPKPISNLIESFERLPGIGPKTAQRLTFYLLHFPEYELEKFANALTGLKTGTKLCDICKNVAENEECEVCRDSQRDKNTILVVASPLDAAAVEKTGYKGIYHILHGIIDPLNNIGPEEIYLEDLITRVKKMVLEPSVFESFQNPIEIILATNSTMEGESTALFITKRIKEEITDPSKVKITRIARGLPVGGDIEYADDITLKRALDGRLTYM